MSKYAPGVDWSNDKHWHCNNNAHPSRHGSYDYISMHPFETVFLKASWHVGEPHLAHYTQWFSAHAEVRVLAFPQDLGEKMATEYHLPSIYCCIAFHARRGHAAGIGSR